MLPRARRSVPRFALVSSAVLLLLAAGGANQPALAGPAARRAENAAPRARVERSMGRARAGKVRRTRSVRERLRTTGKNLRWGKGEHPGVVVGPRANPIEHLPGAKGERIVFGVMGGAGNDTPAATNKLVHELGAHIAEAGHVVLTGAAPGLPDEAVRGAREKGGLTVGISSYSSVRAHRKAGSPLNFDVLKTTKLPPSLRRYRGRPNYMGREIDNIEHSDVIVITGGRFGTLGELAIALEEKRPVGVLVGSGGIADEVKRIVAASTRAGKAPGAPVIYDSNPQRLVRRLAEAKRAMDRAGIERGPLGEGVTVPAKAEAHAPAPRRKAR